MECPKCNSIMSEITFEGIEIERCTNCQGMWFDIMEHVDLGKIPGSEAIDVGDAEKGRKYNEIDEYDCPKCGGKMLKLVDVRQPHIWYESCHSCKGAFFDAGEFRDYKDYTVADFFKDLNTPERK